MNNQQTQTEELQQLVQELNQQNAVLENDVEQLQDKVHELELVNISNPNEYTTEEDLEEVEHRINKKLKRLEQAVDEVAHTVRYQ
jgi:hypothetical protein